MSGPTYGSPAIIGSIVGLAVVGPAISGSIVGLAVVGYGWIGL